MPSCGWQTLRRHGVQKSSLECLMKSEKTVLGSLATATKRLPLGLGVEKRESLCSKRKKNLLTRSEAFFSFEFNLQNTSDWFRPNSSEISASKCMQNKRRKMIRLWKQIFQGWVDLSSLCLGCAPRGTLFLNNKIFSRCARELSKLSRMCIEIRDIALFSLDCRWR